jgi:hypothetical protein
MTSNLAISLDKVTIPEELRPNVQHNRMVDSVAYPLCENFESKEVVLLAHHVKLGVSIQQASRDELIQNTER